MMISSEGYYEEYLKGKTAKHIMNASRGLKDKIGHLLFGVNDCLGYKYCGD